MLSKYSEFQIIVWHLHIKDNSTAVKEGVPREVIIDQTALNIVIKEMVSTHSLSMVVLDTQQYPCGKVYFEDEKRMFLEDRDKHDVAFIVHNNFLLTKVMKYIMYDN